METTLSFLKEKAQIINDDNLSPCIVCGYELNYIHIQKEGRIRKL